jgi:Ni/Co efflux regulator RcnB
MAHPNSSRTVVTVAGLALAFALAAAPEASAKPKKQKKHAVVFVDADRAAYRQYWADTYGRSGCPPGLAKKRNGCLPPGQAKKRYAIGRALPRAVVVERVPVVLVPRLRTAPPGYEYVLVDGDVLLMSTRDRVIADAIVALID